MVGEKKPSPGKCNSLHQHLFPIFVYSHSTLAAEYEISWFSRSYKWLTANCFPSVLHERTILHSLHRFLCMDSYGLLCSSTSTFFYWLSLVYDVVPAAILASNGVLQGCHTPRMSSSCGCFYLCTVLLERRVLVCGGGGFDASNGGKVVFHATWRFSVVKVYNVYYTHI